jgi:hypothetical protein
MQEKTIKSVINKKFNDWVNSIEDEDVRKAVKANSIIAGGAITSLMHNEKPNDFDIYFQNKETLLKVAKYYAKKFNENHPFMHNKLDKKIECFVLDGETIENFEDSSIVIHDEEVNKQIDKNNEIDIPKNENGELILSAKTDEKSGLYYGFSRMFVGCPKDRVKMIIMSDGFAGGLPSHEDPSAENLTATQIVEELDEINSNEVEKEIKEKYRPVFITTNAITLSDKIQLIVRFYGTPDEIHKNFDYEHTKSYWSSWNNQLDIPRSVYECVMNKTLKYTGSKYPICSVFRMRKFIERGWTINAGQILKMSFHINELDLKDIDVLEDQLIGVDSVYFNNLIAQIKEQQATNKDFTWNFNYVISIVNKIF